MEDRFQTQKFKYNSLKINMAEASFSYCVQRRHMQTSNRKISIQMESRLTDFQ